ncbi:hypothetical protein Bca52824_028668 [Brassica carinata]|uniref:Uncharacterized protein n=1 Tax=Brassica carinata TaxID=52824 RepID=A0A8X8ANE0_BRACI|nr:hypothetical protein Bca52824_028668 [Brassica carinata]
MGADFLLVDEKSTLTLGTVSENCLDTFRQRFHPRTAIGISKYKQTSTWCRVELYVSDLTDDAVFVAFDMEIVKLTSIQASEAAQILGDGQEPNDDVPVEKPIASNGSVGADNTLAEVASVVGAEGGETTSANHQPSSSVVAGLVRSASTIPYLTHMRIEKRRPAWHSYSCRSKIPTYYTY